MAPRRGGGGGGGGGGDDGDGDGGIGDTPWGEIVQLYGSHFHDSYAVASIVFLAIGIVCTVGILIFAASFRKPTDHIRKIFKWYAFKLSIIALFIWFGIRFAVDIIYENETPVEQVFFLIITVISQFGYVAEISLFGVFYLLLPHISSHPSRQSRRHQLWSGLQAGHATFILILTALWAATMAYKIKYQVEFVIGERYGIFERDLQPAYRFDTAYAILYFVGALEIAAWAILSLLHAKKQGDPMMISIVLCAAVSFPFLLRSAYNMGDTIHTELLHKFSNRSGTLAFDVIYTICSIAIYAGIVIICRKLAKLSAEPPDPNYIDPSYDPNFWGANNGGQHYDPKNPMSVNQEGVSPPVYQQHVNFPHQPYPQSHPNSQMLQQQYPPYPQPPHHPQPPYPQYSTRAELQTGQQYQTPYAPPARSGVSNSSATELPSPLHSPSPGNPRNVGT